MSTSKHIDVICLSGVLFAILLTGFFLNAEAFGIEISPANMGYESRLFDTSVVHTIDIVMDDWDAFLETCEKKEYLSCAVVIDGQVYKNIGIRAKGNNSLSSVAAYGNSRYSFKLEFDHYDSAGNYFGLDKISLTSLIQDNTMMKDYLVYQMMAGFGVDAPLCSYAYITVNGEDWGLYLVAEGIEESFLRRNYGSDYGNLYKPDSMNLSGEPQRGGQPGGVSSDDVKLQYQGDDPDSYPNIFDNAKTDVSEADQQRLIASIRALNEGTDLETVLNIDEILRYFVVHNFVCNFDSYTGQVIHNYYLYEEDGVLSMIPWDYNLAFGSFQSNAGTTEIINFPIDTPVTDGDLDNRPMAAWIFHDPAYTRQYHQYFAQFLAEYFESGAFEKLIEETFSLISPYVEKDPTKFCTYEEFEKGVAVLREFCLLRAESVSGQLDGSIPATSEGQQADSSALIDGSAININDTGSMNGGAPNGGQPAPDFDAARPQEIPENGSPSGGNEGGENAPPFDWQGGQPENAPNRPGGDPGQWNPPAGGLPNEQEGGSSGSILILIVSAAVLSFGLVFARLFKGK